MKIRKYQELCKVCDQILINNISVPQIVANNYFHVLNSHPEFLKKYDLSMTTKAWISLRFKMIFIVRIIQSIFDRKNYYTKQEYITSDVLFVSHLISEQQLLSDRDAYFGNLSKLLLKNGMSSSTALINHTNVSNRKVLISWKGSEVFRLVLNPNLDFLSEIRLYFSQKKSKKQLRFALRSLRVDKRLVNDMLRNHLSAETFNALRIATQVANIAKKIDAKYVVTTYEGFAWERLVYYYVRKVNPSIKCLGYQHAAVFKYQHAIKRPLSKEYNPDIFLTSGLVAKEIFEQSQLKDFKIVCMGSPKYLKPSLVTGEKRCCLVVPEGHISECLILFKFSLSYAEQNLNQKFIWRLHPLLSFKDLKKYSSIFNNLPNNIHLSTDNFDDDIGKCDSVLYRGSTAVVQAINSGLKPIYYQQSDDELSIDPIYKQKLGKEIVCSQRDLSRALDKNINTKVSRELQDFAQDFYTPIDITVLLKILQYQ